MPVRKTKRGGRTCHKVKGVKTKKCMTKAQAQKQDVAVRISKAKRKRRGKG
ncbi:MAG: hypothetical protein ACXABY_02935 [Candidatus Thorarchaeota archaeon]